MCVECQSEENKKKYERECAVWNCSGKETRRDDPPDDYKNTVMSRCDHDDFKKEYPKECNDMATITLNIDKYGKGGNAPETDEQKESFKIALEKELPWLKDQIAIGDTKALNSFAIEIIIIPGKEPVFKLAHKLSRIAAGKGKDKFTDSTKNPILSQLLYPGKQTQKQKEQEVTECQNQLTAAAEKATEAEKQVQTIQKSIADCTRKNQKLLELKNIHTREWKSSRAEHEIESKRLQRLLPSTHGHKHRTYGRRTKGGKSKGARCKPGQCAGSMTCSRKTKKCWHGKGRGQGTKCVPGQCKGSLQCSRRTKRCH